MAKSKPKTALPVFLPAQPAVASLVFSDTMGIMDSPQPNYWNSICPTDVLLGEIVSGIEVHLRPVQRCLVVVSDLGPGSPEELGTVPAFLGPRPPDPDREGVAEDDPLWMEMSDRDLAWIRAVVSSSLFKNMQSMRASKGHELIEALLPVYDKKAGPVEFWLADAAARTLLSFEA